ncbi:MAG: ATP-binding protein [Bacteroidales bacterium]|jgi:predicted HTH transcriptional regulator|nr:ATP-binding protein [Bacteroidales bacterium]
MSLYIQQLIDEGEHQQQDFKFEISDSKKIARSLTAFANTDGGRLLVGVKDNGAIAGVRSDEEIHMVEAAAQLYCQPEVSYTTKEWNINGKLVLEITVPKSKHQKHKAPDKNNNYKIFVRVNDQNLLADSILLKVWKKQESKAPVKIAFTETEMQLLRYLDEFQRIELEKFMAIAQIKKRKAEGILIDFILLGIIQLKLTEKQTWFQLQDTGFMDRIDDYSGISHPIIKNIVIQ